MTSTPKALDAPGPATAFLPGRISAGPFARPSALPPSTWPVAILGVPIDPVGFPEALGRIGAFVESGRPHYVATANVDFLVQARRDVELHRILMEADLVLCDGTPVLWASRLLGNPLPERVAGSDLAPWLLKTAAARGWRLFLLGAAPGVAAEAVGRIRDQVPGVNVVGEYAPGFADLLAMDHSEIIGRIRAAAPDVLLVSFGCPKQEKWIAMHYRSLGVPVVIGVGATIDFLAGRRKRAPRWMARTGTEWFYRLLLEPRRLARRYAADLVQFVPALAAQWWRLRPTPGGAEGGRPPRLWCYRSRPWLHLAIRGRLDGASLRAFEPVWSEAEGAGQHWLLSLARATQVDSTGIAALIRWRKTLAATSRRLIVLAPSPRLRRALERQRLGEHLAVAPDRATARRWMAADTDPPLVVLNADGGALAWSGEVTAENAREVQRLTAARLASLPRGRHRCVIDLSQVRYIDSSGADMMRQVQATARRLRLEVVYAGAQAPVANVLRAARLDDELLQEAA